MRRPTSRFSKRFGGKRPNSPLSTTHDVTHDTTHNLKILLDFDGVIHDYDEWHGPIASGYVIPGVKMALKMLSERGIKPDIFTTRPKRNVEAFLRKHALRHYIGKVIDKKPFYDAFFDDRAHNIRANYPFDLCDKLETFFYARENPRSPQ